MIGPESCLRQGERILSQQASGTLILLHLDTGEYYALNDVGRRVWELCDGTRQVADVVALLCQEYDAPAETIAADVLALVQELAYEQLVVEGNETAGGAAASTAS
jgi:coenzyme PQQ biosynthesis protein PqqD